MKYLISHVDLDGYGVNVLNTMYSDVLDFDEILNLNYGFEESPNVKELITPENEIVITDLSLPEEVYVEWKGILKSLMIIDHHDTSVYLTHYEGNVWSVERCGTFLFWEHYLLPRIKESRWADELLIDDKATFLKVEKFVDLVDCYDRWQDNSSLWEDAARLNKLCVSMGAIPFIEHMVKKFHMIWEWTADECQCFGEIEKIENDILSKVEEDLEIRKDSIGLNFVFIKIDEKSKLSMVCSKLLRRHPEIDYCVCYGGSRKSFSLRTNKDLNLTRIHGVMGHKQAAGAQFTKPEFYALLMDGKCLNWVKEGQRKLDHISIGESQIST